MLRSGCDFHFDIAVESLDRHVCSKHCLTDRDEQICVDVGPFSLKVSMRFYLNVNDQVTCWRSYSCVPFLRYSQVHAVVNSLRNAYAFLHLTMASASASACNTGTLDDLANTIAVATDLLDHEWSLANRLETLTTTTTTL